MTKLFGPVHMEPNNFLWKGSCVLSASGIHEVAANRPLEILSTNLSTVEKRLRKRRISNYAIRSPVIHLALNCAMANETCEYLNLMKDQATTAFI